jgi:type IV pilus assembly protein PilQ
MDAREKKVIKAGIAGILVLCVMMVCGLVTPVMGEESDLVVAQPEMAVITNITLTHKGNSDVVAVTADHQFVYSYYPLSDPPRAVVELAQSDPGNFSDPLSYKGGVVKQLKFVKQDLGSGRLTRLEFFLLEGTDFSVRSLPEDSRKLLITFSPGATKPLAPVFAPLSSAKGALPPSLPVKPVSTIQVPPVTMAQRDLTPVAAKSPVYVAPRIVPPVNVSKSPSSESLAGRPAATKAIGSYLRKIIATPLGIDLLVDGPVESYTVFFMKKPNRMVVDLPGVRIALSADNVPLKVFGIDRVRLGRHEGKSRLVFEGGTDAVLKNRLIKSDIGLRLVPPAPADPAKAP